MSDETPEEFRPECAALAGLDAVERLMLMHSLRLTVEAKSRSWETRRLNQFMAAIQSSRATKTVP